MKNAKLIIFTIFVFFVSLANAKALSCIYQNGNMTFTCNMDEQNFRNNNVGCNFSDSKANRQSLHIRLSKNDYTLETSTSKRLACSQVSTIYVDMLKTKKSWNLYDIRKDNNNCPLSLREYNNNKSNYEIAPSGCTAFTLKNNASSNIGGNPSNNGNNSSNNGNNSSNNNGNNSGSGTTNSGTNGGNNSNKPSSTTSDIDLEHFCKGNVLTVFRAVGWIFFTVKIVVPLLLIIFGCIDFAKAIIISKDDEIKKSIKSLVIRSIAGILIFFVPAAINLVAEVIGGEDIYRGSEFGACTECILDPNSAACK